MSRMRAITRDVMERPEFRVQLPRWSCPTAKGLRRDDEMENDTHITPVRSKSKSPELARLALSLSSILSLARQDSNCRKLHGSRLLSLRRNVYLIYSCLILVGEVHWSPYDTSG